MSPLIESYNIGKTNLLLEIRIIVTIRDLGGGGEDGHWKGNGSGILIVFYFLACVLAT